MTVIFLSSGLYNLIEFTEHVNSVPLRVLSTELSMRTPGLTVDAPLHVPLHSTASGDIPGTVQVILVELPTWRLEYSPDIDISKTGTHGKQQSYNNGQKYLTQ